VPAEEPRLAMLVMLDEPKNEKWGSEAAAPIFSAIGGGVLRYLDVPPSDATPVAIVSGPSDTAAAARAKAPIVDDAAGDSRVMPELRGRTLRNALAALAPLGVGVKVDGRGLVVAQAPAPGAALPADTGVRLTLASAASR
jgi:cell division protein FtsI (penicillin-binding protein 3)